MCTSTSGDPLLIKIPSSSSSSTALFIARQRLYYCHGGKGSEEKGDRAAGVAVGGGSASLSRAGRLESGARAGSSRGSVRGRSRAGSRRGAAAAFAGGRGGKRGRRGDAGGSAAIATDVR